MATFTTKFSLSEVAYIVDAKSALVLPVTVSEVFVKQGLSYGSQIVITYTVRHPEIPSNRVYDESLLLTSEEAKVVLSQAIADRETLLQGLP